MSRDADQIEVARRAYVAAMGTENEGLARRHLEAQIERVKKTARSMGECDNCRKQATLARRKDGTGWRALYWCFGCEKAAFSGSSFVHCASSTLDKLPIVDDSSRQGTLL